MERNLIIVKKPEITCQPTVGQESADKWQTDGRKSDDC